MRERRGKGGEKRRKKEMVVSKRNCEKGREGKKDDRELWVEKRWNRKSG